MMIAVVAAAAVASAQQRYGTITRLTLSTPATDVGATVTATAVGSGTCSAVLFDWGDGTAITYPTEVLPVSRTHAYKTAGTFTLRVEGRGACAGEAFARITIRAPAPPPPVPHLTAIVLPASPAEPRTPVAITLEGTGACRLTLDFGDGNNQELRGSLPATVRHTYALPGRYTIVATPMAPCAERRTADLEVGARRAQRLTAVDVAVPPGAAPGLRSITVGGSGRCAYVLDFGDGNSEPREAALPDVVRHNYPAAGRYTVVATAQPPCSGQQRSTFVVGGDLHGSVTAVDVRPQLGRVGQPIAVTVAGTGRCKFVVDFDDGESRTLTERLPYRLTYRYVEAGDYEIVVWTHEPCTGAHDALLRIRPR